MLKMYALCLSFSLSLSHTHTHTHARVRTHTHTHTHNFHTNANTQSLTHVYTQKSSNIHYTHSLTHTHTHICTHTSAHTHTHTHTHTLSHTRTHLAKKHQQSAAAKDTRGFLSNTACSNVLSCQADTSFINDRIKIFSMVEMNITTGLQLGRTEVLRSLRTFQSKDRPEYHSNDHLKEKSDAPPSDLKKNLNFNLTNIGTVSRPILEKLWLSRVCVTVGLPEHCKLRNEINTSNNGWFLRTFHVYKTFIHWEKGVTTQININ